MQRDLQPNLSPRNGELMDHDSQNPTVMIAGDPEDLQDLLPTDSPLAERAIATWQQYQELRERDEVATLKRMRDERAEQLLTSLRDFQVDAVLVDREAPTAQADGMIFGLSGDDTLRLLAFSCRCATDAPVEDLIRLGGLLVNHERYCKESS